MQKIGEIIGICIGSNKFIERFLIDIGDEMIGNLIALRTILHSFDGLGTISMFLQKFIFLFYYS